MVSKEDLEFLKEVKENTEERSIRYAMKQSGLDNGEFIVKLERLTGLTTREYERVLELKKVKRALIEGKSVSEALKESRYPYLDKLDRDFKEIEGITPTDYKSRFLLRRAKNLLRKRRGRDIWKELGFKSREYFDMFFKRERLKEVERQEKDGKRQEKYGDPRRLKRESEHATPCKYRYNCIVNEVEKLILKNPNLTISEVAKEFDIEGNHLSTVYKNKRGITLGQYKEIVQRIATINKLEEIYSRP